MYVLGYDIGSSSVKASLVNVESGNVQHLPFSRKQKRLSSLSNRDGLNRTRRAGGIT